MQKTSTQKKEDNSNNNEDAITLLKTTTTTTSAITADGSNDEAARLNFSIMNMDRESKKDLQFFYDVCGKARKAGIKTFSFKKMLRLFRATYGNILSNANAWDAFESEFTQYLHETRKTAIGKSKNKVDDIVESNSRSEKKND